jgi:hypothetical protein
MKFALWKEWPRPAAIASSLALRALDGSHAAPAANGGEASNPAVGRPIPARAAGARDRPRFDPPSTGEAGEPFLPLNSAYAVEDGSWRDDTRGVAHVSGPSSRRSAAAPKNFGAAAAFLGATERFCYRRVRQKRTFAKAVSIARRRAYAQDAALASSARIEAAAEASVRRGRTARSVDFEIPADREARSWRAAAPGGPSADQRFSMQ